MSARKLMFVAIPLLYVAMSVMPVGASCAGGIHTDEKSLEVHFARSDAVFMGRPVSQRVIAPAREGDAHFTDTTFEIEELWKGPHDAQTLVVRTCGYRDPRTGQEQICGGSVYFFDIGSRYVLFVRGTPLWVQCEPVELVNGAPHVLAWLSGQPRQNPVK